MRLLAIGSVMALSATCLAQQQATPAPSLKPGHSSPDAYKDAPQISIEVRFVTAPYGVTRQLVPNAYFRFGQEDLTSGLPQIPDEQLKQSGGIHLVSATTLVEQRRPLFVESLDDTKVRQMLEAFRQEARSNIMFAPKVTLFDRQVAEIQDTVERPFVVSVRPVNDALTPEISLVEEGTRINLRATVMDDRAVRLDMDATLSDILDVMTLQGGHEGAAVQMPTVKKTNVRLSGRLAPGRTLAVWGLQHQQRVTVEQATPIVDKVPYLSRMFVNKGVAVENQDMLMLITPTVLDTGHGVD